MEIACLTTTNRCLNPLIHQRPEREFHCKNDTITTFLFDQCFRDIFSEERWRQLCRKRKEKVFRFNKLSWESKSFQTKGLGFDSLIKSMCCLNSTAKNTLAHKNFTPPHLPNGLFCFIKFGIFEFHRQFEKRKTLRNDVVFIRLPQASSLLLKKKSLMLNRTTRS